MANLNLTDPGKEYYVRIDAIGLLAEVEEEKRAAELHATEKAEANGPKYQAVVKRGWNAALEAVRCRLDAPMSRGELLEALDGMKDGKRWEPAKPTEEQREKRAATGAAFDAALHEQMGQRSTAPTGHPHGMNRDAPGGPTLFVDERRIQSPDDANRLRGHSPDYIVVYHDRTMPHGLRQYLEEAVLAPMQWDIRQREQAKQLDVLDASPAASRRFVEKREHEMNERFSKAMAAALLRIGAMEAKLQRDYAAIDSLKDRASELETELGKARGHDGSEWAMWVSKQLKALEAVNSAQAKQLEYLQAHCGLAITTPDDSPLGLRIRALEQAPRITLDGDGQLLKRIEFLEAQDKLCDESCMEVSNWHGSMGARIQRMEESLRVGVASDNDQDKRLAALESQVSRHHDGLSSRVDPALQRLEHNAQVHLGCINKQAEQLNGFEKQLQELDARTVSLRQVAKQAHAEDGASDETLALHRWRGSSWEDDAINSYFGKATGAHHVELCAVMEASFRGGWRAATIGRLQRGS